MGVAKDGMAAPGAVVWAPPSRDQRESGRPVVLAPQLKVSTDIDRVAVGDGLGIQFGEVGTGVGAQYSTVTAPVENAWDLLHPVQPVECQVGQQFLQGLFPLALDHDVGPPRKVLLRIVGGVWSAGDDYGPGLPADPDHLQRPRSR